MRLYVDTSYALSLFIEDALTVRAQEWLLGLEGAELTCSTWTLTEFSAAAARYQRTGDLSMADVGGAEHAFAEWVAETVRMVELQPQDGRRALQLVRDPQHTLAGPDALHIAIAERLGSGVLTFDKQMRRAALAIGAIVEPA